MEGTCKKADVYLKNETCEICMTIKLKNGQNYFDQIKEFCNNFTKNYTLISIYFREEKEL